MKPISIAASAYQSYVQKVRGPVRRRAVVRFLLQDPDFPRAFLHCSEQVKSCLQILPNNKRRIRIVNRISRIRRVKPDEMDAKQLLDYIDRLQLNLARLDSLIAKTYFTYQ
jgi:uncharacterized alpha-E superfamily protein